MDQGNCSDQKQHLNIDSSQKVRKSWELCIALEIITQLKTRTTEKVSLQRILSQIKLQELNIFDQAYNKFEMYFKQLKQKSMLTNDLNFDTIKQKLEDKFAIVVIKDIVSISAYLEKEYYQNLEKYIVEDLQNISPEALINFLKNIAKLLFTERRKVKIEQAHNLEKSISINKAYHNLLNCKNLDSESIWNAFNLLFKFRFEEEKGAVIDEVIIKLLQCIQSFYSSACKTYLLLTNVEKLLMNKCLNNLVPLPSFKHLKVLNIDYQQISITSWLGKSITFWGDSLVTAKELETRILKNTYNISESLFNEFQLSFVDNKVIK